MAKYVEDPSIAATARLEHAEMLRELQARVSRGEPYFVAREQIIAEHGPRIAMMYGAKTAKRALAALTSYGPTDMPRHVQVSASMSYLDELERITSIRLGGVWRYTTFDRWLFRTLGFTWGVPRCVVPGTPETKEQILVRSLAEAETRLANTEMEKNATEAKAAQNKKIAADIRFVAKQIKRGRI
jgi:hypothetical protein